MSRVVRKHTTPPEGGHRTVPSEEYTLDSSLRPKLWGEFVGQERTKENLRILVDAARGRDEALDHVLIAGPSGLGKTTLAHIVANTIGANLKVTSGPAIERPGDLASILTNLEPNDILFIDEAHRLPKIVEEILYPAMESRALDIVIGKGTAARTLQLNLPPFTIIAATTRAGALSSPLRSRFGATYFLDFYGHDDIDKILERSAGLLAIRIAKDARKRLARASRSTPRTANRLLKRVRDFAQVHGVSEITEDVVGKALAMLGVDALGLEDLDRKILRVIAERFRGGPAGLQAIAAACAEEQDVILDMCEPYLLRIGFVERTPRGRLVTKEAYRHLGLQAPQEQPRLM